MSRQPINYQCLPPPPPNPFAPAGSHRWPWSVTPRRNGYEFSTPYTSPPFSFPPSRPSIVGVLPLAGPQNYNLPPDKRSHSFLKQNPAKCNDGSYTTVRNCGKKCLIPPGISFPLHPHRFLPTARPHQHLPGTYPHAGKTPCPRLSFFFVSFFAPALPSDFFSHGESTFPDTPLPPFSKFTSWWRPRFYPPPFQ